MLSKDLINIPPQKHLDLLPKLLKSTMKSFRTQDRDFHTQCIAELEKIQQFHAHRIEQTFVAVMDPESNSNLDVKITTLQILIHEIRQFVKLAQDPMRLKISKTKYLQYPIPATVKSLFFWLEKEKILIDLLDFNLVQQKDLYFEQVHHIRSQIQNVYQTNKAKIRAYAANTNPIPTIHAHNDYKEEKEKEYELL